MQQPQPEYSNNEYIRWAVRYCYEWDHVEDLIYNLEQFLKEYPEDRTIRKICLSFKYHLSKRKILDESFYKLDKLVGSSQNQNLYKACRYCYNWSEFEPFVCYLENYLKDYPLDEDILEIHNCAKCYLDERESLNPVFAELEKLYC